MAYSWKDRKFFYEYEDGRHMACLSFAIGTKDELTWPVESRRYGKEKLRQELESIARFWFSCSGEVLGP